jgi:Tfp pilus assembly protein PilX
VNFAPWKNSAENGTRHGRGSCVESGMILLLALALLAGLSLLALLAANSMLQQEQMAANHADMELARLSAMSAISSGERYLLAMPGTARIENCASGCFGEPAQPAVHDPGTLPPDAEFMPDDWWLEWGLTATTESRNNFSETTAISAWSLPGRYPPQFLVEELRFVANTDPVIEETAPEVAGIGYYRILARGTGVAGSSTHVAESIMARPWQLLTSENQSDGIDCKAFRPWYDCGRMAYRERR